MLIKFLLYETEVNNIMTTLLPSAIMINSSHTETCTVGHRTTNIITITTTTTTPTTTTTITTTTTTTTTNNNNNSLSSYH
jgi:hypothetical protein